MTKHLFFQRTKKTQKKTHTEREKLTEGREGKTLHNTC